MAIEWYYSVGGEQFGPVSWDTLKQLVSEKKIAASDLVWNESMPEWVEARNVEGLVPQAPAVRKPPPLPAKANSGPAPLATGTLSHPDTASPSAFGDGPPPADLEQRERQEEALAKTLLYPAIAMLTVAGLALLLACFALYMLAKEGELNGKPTFGFVLFLFNSVAAILATVRMGMLKEWGSGVAASVLVMTDWLCLLFTPFPVGLTLIGSLAGISVGAWCLFVLWKPEVRNCFGRTPSLPSLWERIRISMEKQTQAAQRDYEERVRSKQESSRRSQLVGLWEPVTFSSQWIMFTTDNGMLRGDGFGTKFRWLDGDRIELYADETDKTVQFTVLSLGEFELILKVGDQTVHFKKGVTITEELRCQREEEYRQRRAEAAVGLKNAAVGVASVLAAGGFAVLCCGVAVAAASSAGRCRCRWPIPRGGYCVNCGYLL
jgi:hypothetical protein